LIQVHGTTHDKQTNALCILLENFVKQIKTNYHTALITVM